MRYPLVMESQHVGATDECPHPELWYARDAQASEFEVGEFLHGLIRLLKPALAIETGCYLGDTSSFMAMALNNNHTGRLVTCDVNESYVKETRQTLKDLPATVQHMTGIEMLHGPIGLQEVDLAFLDSGGDRLEEARALKLSKHGIVALHDARHKDYAGFADKLGWQEIFIPTPRGLSIFQAKR